MCECVCECVSVFPSHTCHQINKDRIPFSRLSELYETGLPLCAQQERREAKLDVGRVAMRNKTGEEEAGNDPTKARQNNRCRNGNGKAE